VAQRGSKIYQPSGATRRTNAATSPPPTSVYYLKDHKGKGQSSISCPRARLHAAATSKSAALRKGEKKLHRGAVNYEKCRRAREPNHATHRTGLGRATNPPASRRPGRRGGRRIGDRTGSSPDKRNEFGRAVEVRAASCWLPRNLGGSPRGDEPGDGNWRWRRRRERGEHGRRVEGR
jgi:hypothetical protein